MTFPDLCRSIVFKNMRREKFLTLLSIIGVALGIGLFIGVKAASDKAVVSFEADIRGINPHANYEVLDTSGIDFPEGVYPDVRRIAEDSFPLLQVSGYLPDLSETAEIRGIDVVRTAGFLGISPGREGRFQDVFTNLNGIIITKSFASRHSIERGGTLSAFVYDRIYSLKVVSVIDIVALPANIFFMDLGNFQEYFAKEGLLSRIDIAADNGTASAIQKILPPSLAVVRKEQAIQDQKSVIRSFRYNLQFVSLIAVLVGVFLLYNTIFISVVKRRAEIGLLRGLGASKKTVVLLFMTQGVILGVIGSILGIAVGQAAAFFSVSAVEKTLTAMYRTITISDYFISRGDMVLALALGIIVSLLASLVPSLEAARVRPTESTREGTVEGRYRGRLRFFAAAGLLLILSGCLLAYVDYRSMPYDFPFLSYGGILLIIFGFTLLSPSYLSIVLGLIKVPAEKIFPTEGVIAVGDMKGSLNRFSVALMSVAISSALIFSLLTLIFSFRDSLKGWIHKNIAADAYVKPASCRSNFCFFPLSEDLVKTVEGLPEVAAVDRFRTLKIDFEGRNVTAGFGDREILRELGRPRGNGAGASSCAGKSVGVSKYLAIQYGLKEGDRVGIRTPEGRERFRVCDIFSSYSTTSGFVYLDRKWLKTYWGLDDATQLGIYLKKGVPVNAFIEKLKALLLPRYSLEITNTAQLSGQVLSIFDRTFAITYAIELIAIVVSLIGVINTLLALVLERRREISIFRYLGGSWRQIRLVLLLSAGIVGMAGAVLGGLMGPLMSIIFIQVINKVSFGWEIHYHIPLLYLFLVTTVLLCATLVSGLIPLQIARKIDPRRLISFE